MTLTALASVALAACLVNLFLRHGFWYAAPRLLGEGPPLDAWPAVVAVVPARNEADVIGPALASLLRQDYPGRFSVVVVDDRSEDLTAARARAAAAELALGERLELVEGTPLPAGWSGKMWAVEQGVGAAERRGQAAYLLLTDADIVHHPATLRQLVAKAGREELDLVSLMALLRAESFWERLLIPAFVFFFQMLYPFPEVNRRETRLAAAAGGCMLVRKSALARAGGIAAIRGAIIDDVALARRIKGSGGAIWLGLTEQVLSIRPYDTLVSLWRMVARSAYTQLDYSPLLLLLAVLGMAAVFLVPPVVLVLGVALGHHLAAGLALLAWLGLAVMYAPTLKLYREPRWRALLLPAAAALYMAMTVDSARRHWRGSGGAWKGRSYARSQSSTG